ncbi:MAG: YqzL family protein [Vulcanimicrobiota bacterium]
MFWEIFKSTGSINAYLIYKRLKETS